MSFSKSLIEQVFLYKKAMGEQITKEQIQDQPWEESVQAWWESKAYFQESGYFTKLANIPEDYTESQVRIVDKKGLHTYSKVDGEWKYVQSVSNAYSGNFGQSFR